MYYLHGPLARAEIGQNKVQGIDYSYTIHGWLKAVNDGLMQNGNDPGLDGNIPSSGSNPNRWNGRDVAGLELGYYHSTAAITHDDYNAIGNNGHISTKTGSNFKETQVPLYNGNINHTVTTLPNKAQMALNNVVADPLGTNYQYDQLNRLKESINYTNVNTGTNAWLSTLSVGTIPQQWQMRQSYDPMGNITSLVRHAQGGSGVAMDSLTYTYNNSQWTNQLTHVDDIITAGAHTEDIDDQAANNYDYDEIGNLIKDDAEEIASIEWTVYGKIKKITRTPSSTKPDLEFEYNTAGQRVVKKVIDNTGIPDASPYKNYYYVRDASGNIMAVYYHEFSVIEPEYPDENTALIYEHYGLDELDLYGSSRLGIAASDIPLANRYGIYEFASGTYTPDGPYGVTNALPADGVVTYEQVGFKYYEITNHLGNVLATFTDRKVPSINAATGSYNFFNAQVNSVSDYYPFGMQMEERYWSWGNYRFGYQGQEGDNEIDGKGDYLAFEYRVHDTRLGRFLSVDPLTSKYPYYSPYSFSGNRVIDKIELEGLEPTEPEYKWSSQKVYGDFGDYYKNGGYLRRVNNWWVYSRTNQDFTTVHYAWDANLGSSGRWIIFTPVLSECTSCDLKNIVKTYLKPFYYNTKIESKVKVEIGFGDQDVSRILGFEFGKGYSANASYTIAEFDGMEAIKHLSTGFRDYDFSGVISEFGGVGLKGQYSKGIYSGGGSFSVLKYGSQTIAEAQLSGSAGPYGLEATGGVKNFKNPTPYFDLKGTFSVLDLKKEIRRSNVAAPRGYKVFYSTELKVSFSISGFVKDAKKYWFK